MTRTTFTVFGAIALGFVLSAHVVSAASYTWEGAGRAGGTNDPIWTDPANWSVTPATGTAPTLADDVTVSFNADYVGANALEIDAGATANDVVISGFDRNPGNREVEMTGDAQFGTLRVANGGSNDTSNGVFEILAGSTLTLTGGSVSVPTLRDGGSSAFSPITGGGAIDFAGPSVFLDLTNEITVTTVSFTNAAANIENNNQDFEFRGSTLSMLSTQTFNNFPLLRLDGNTNLLSGDSNPLNNLSNVNLGILDRFANSTAPEGTYSSVRIAANTSSTGNPRYRMTGDQEIVSENVGDGTGNAINILRGGRDGNIAAFYVDGYTLNVSSTAPVEIGLNDAFTSYSSLDMTGGAGGANSTVTINGDLILNGDGVLVGDSGSTLSLRGNFRNGSEETSNYNMAASTMILDGEAKQFDEQLLEVQGLDQGAASHAAGMTQFGIGDLQIGTGLGSTSWVGLVDEFDFDNDSISDAMYVDTLTVEKDSFLVLNGLNLYVSGVQVFAGDTQYGDGTILNFASDYVPPVPEPNSLVLLGLGLLFLRKRNRKSEK